MIKKDRRVVVIEPRTHTKLTVEMSKQGRTRKAIVEDAVKMYLEYKESERLLNKERR